MSLAAQLSKISANASKVLSPESLKMTQGALKKFQDSFSPESAIKVGDTLPSFQMSNAVGVEVTSKELLDQGMFQLPDSIDNNPILACLLTI